MFKNERNSENKYIIYKDIETEELFGGKIGKNEVLQTILTNDEKRLNSISTIERIVNILEMEEKYIPDYIKFIKNNPVEIIKRYISKHNLSYVEFAKESKISVNTLYGWLEGKTNQIPVSGYEKLKTYIGQELLSYM